MRDQPYLQTSILDRLIDREPELPAEPVPRRLATLNSLSEAVLRDLENLLNTRAGVSSPPDSCQQVQASVLSYGTKDFTSQNPRSDAVRRQIRLEVQRLLLLFEPRLRKVTVRLDTAFATERILYFRIEALLQVEPLPAVLTFDTCLDINNGTYSILK